MDDDFDKFFDGIYLDTYVSIMFVSDGEENVDTRFGTNLYPHGENILSSIYWRGEEPKCSF